MTRTAAADFVFDVQIACTVCRQVIDEAVRGVVGAWGGALACRPANLDL
jgi:hypothetical protein